MIADGWIERLGRQLARPPRRQRTGRTARRPASATRARRRALRLPRPGIKAAIGLVAAVAVLGVAWLWFRDSSLVAVRRVTVTGVSGPDARRIRAALAIAARNMTTLDVNTAQLNTAVAPYPVVKSLRVSTQFPHGMRIAVVEQIPVGVITIGGRRIAVASDGTLLHDAAPASQLPTIALPSLPGGAQIADRNGRALVAMLAAAPFQLLSHLSQASLTAAHGLTAQLRGGPSIYFGDAGRLRAKWSAAVAVLANGGSAGALYVDVSDPQRPVAGAGTGGGAGTSGAVGGSATATQTAATATGTATTTTGTAATTTGTAATTTGTVPASGTSVSSAAGTPSTTPPGG